MLSGLQPQADFRSTRNKYSLEQFRELASSAGLKPQTSGLVKTSFSVSITGSE